MPPCRRATSLRTSALCGALQRARADEPAGHGVDLDAELGRARSFGGSSSGTTGLSLTTVSSPRPWTAARARPRRPCSAPDPGCRRRRPGGSGRRSDPFQRRDSRALLRIGNGQLQLDAVGALEQAEHLAQLCVRQPRRCSASRHGEGMLAEPRSASQGCLRDALGDARHRGDEPPHAARARRDGPRLRAAAGHPAPGEDRDRVRGALHPHLQGHVRRDAASLSAAPARRAGDVPARADRPQRHRHLARRRLRQPRHVQPHLPRDRRRVAVRVPRARRCQGGARLLHDGAGRDRAVLEKPGGAAVD